MILDLRPVTAYTDFFVLATGRNARQTKAIYDEVHERMKADERLRPRAVEGAREGNWIVADYLDVVRTSSRRIRASTTGLDGPSGVTCPSGPGGRFSLASSGSATIIRCRC